jgi:Alpha-kinase family
MAFHQQQTSLISILSSDHGRLRREQRDIEKRDLQKAIKHGTRQRCWGNRWMIEYDGIVFVTNNSMTQEVTVYPSPLSLAPIKADSRAAHSNAAHLLEIKPELSVSHTVLVVDNSGSMMIHDINLHRDRQTAAYTMTALEFVAEQLFNGTANNSDLVSLVEFSNQARVIFSREPVSWVLYNKLLSRRDARTFRTRESAKMREYLVCDSNYLPALNAAEGLLATSNHETCALSLFFLSDGAPSDAREMGLTPDGAQRRMSIRAAEIASRFSKQLTVKMVGFGNAYADFSALRSMVEAINAAVDGAPAEFLYCDKISNAIGTAVTSLVTSLTATRTALMEGATKRGYTKRGIASEKETQIYNDWRYYSISDHFVIDPKSRAFVNYPGLPPGAIREVNRSEAARRKSSPPPFLAINTKSCGEGVERVAFRCHLSDGKKPDMFRFGAMVAKETNSVERIEENEDFHRGFCETQSLAAHLATEFNKRLRALPTYRSFSTPQIIFLPCSVLLVDDAKWPKGRRGVLVEKMLDTEHLGWTKWNNNAGAVDGRVAHIPLDVEHELAKLHATTLDLGALAEGDSEGDSDEDSLVEEAEAAKTTQAGGIEKPSDYLQAFTHFTYLYTNKKVMVCDLQGVYDADAVPPTFELSDPAIHYASKRREMVFGRTDKGRKGMQLFFNTHRCTSVCKFMQLSKKNKKWRTEWHWEGILAGDT